MIFVIGAGLFGATIAERIASVMDKPVTVIEKRSHIGGNCYSSFDEETGIECHRYGSHIFHTSVPEVWKYLSQFTEFTSYRHKVLTTHNNATYTMPINLFTINAFFNKNLSPYEAEKFLANEISRDYVENPINLEEKAISLAGRPLYEAFIKGYTHKQWGCDPKELSADIINRLPFRMNYNTDYFNDIWQGIPKNGYLSLFQKMLTHPNITLRLDCDYFTICDEIPPNATVIYTGMPDQLFNYKYGELEWRSLHFEWEKQNIRDFQGTSVMNYADIDVPYTRIHEFKHFHPERTTLFTNKQTVICREYPLAYSKGNEAYYPINNARNTALYERYTKEAAKIPNLILGGRLGAYRYWDMDQAVLNALNLFKSTFICKKS